VFKSIENICFILNSENEGLAKVRKYRCILKIKLMHYKKVETQYIASLQKYLFKIIIFLTKD